MSHPELLVRLVRDAFAGHPVKFGYTEIPQLMATLKALQIDAPGRAKVFESAIRAAVQLDPSLKSRLRAILDESKAHAATP